MLDILEENLLAAKVAMAEDLRKLDEIRSTGLLSGTRQSRSTYAIQSPERGRSYKS